MESEYAVAAKQVSKIYKLYNGQKERLKDLLFTSNYGKDFYARLNERRRCLTSMRNVF